MSAGWIATAAATVAALLWPAVPASAHRLDEFLQATTIAVEKTRITVQVRLTPGVAVVPGVLAEIDTNGDGILSDTEQRRYAERVLRDLSLSLDGDPLSLRLLAYDSPGVEEIKQGLGTILLTFRADVPPGAGARKLVFKNHYRSAMAAYLVNCLFPEDPGIRIITQDRSEDQSFYEAGYTQVAGTPPDLPRR